MLLRKGLAMSLDVFGEFLPPLRRVQRGKLSVSADKMFSRNAFYCIRNSVNNVAGQRKLEYMKIIERGWTCRMCCRGMGCNWWFCIFL